MFFVGSHPTKFLLKFEKCNLSTSHRWPQLGLTFENSSTLIWTTGPWWGLGLHLQTFHCCVIRYLTHNVTGSYYFHQTDLENNIKVEPSCITYSSLCLPHFFFCCLAFLLWLPHFFSFGCLTFILQSAMIQQVLIVFFSSLTWEFSSAWNNVRHLWTSTKAANHIKLRQSHTKIDNVPVPPHMLFCKLWKAPCSLLGKVILLILQVILN